MEAILPRKKFVPVQATPIRGHMRMLLFGPGGGGKSYTACELAYGLTVNGKIGVIDTEFGRIRDYADVFNFIVVTLEDEPNAKPFERCFPQRIFEALDALLEAGCDTIILDSLTHGLKAQHVGRLE